MNNTIHGEPYDGKLSRTVRERGRWILRIREDLLTLVHSLIYGERKGALYGSIATVLLAIIFTVFQGVEYNVSSFTISDGAFGTCFFFGTGFHGFHVLIGTIFLSVALWRIYAYHLTDNHHVGFESGILYWHFVDVVWLFLYISIYYWGS